MKPKLKFKVKIPKEMNFIPFKDLKRVYREELSKRVSKIDMFAKMTYPNFFFDVFKINQDDIDSIGIEPPMPVEISFDEFEKLVSPEGLLYNLETVQRLMTFIEVENRVEILYDWMIKGYKQEPKDLVEFLDKITDHCRLKNGYAQIKEFCRLFPCTGSKFLNEFLETMKETIQHDLVNTDVAIQPQEDMLRTEAYEYIQMQMKKQGMDYLPEIPTIDTTIKKKKYVQYLKGFQMKFPKTANLPYPMENRSDSVYKTDLRRHYLFSDSRKVQNERVEPPTPPRSFNTGQF